MNQTLSLYRIQQVDNQIDRVQNRLLSIQKILEDNIELSLAIEKVASTQANFLSTDLALKDAEIAAENQRIKIEQTEASLYTGKGHSTKELLDLQNDVSALKRYLIQLEDIQLDAMEDAERAADAYHLAQSELISAQNITEEQNRDLNEERIIHQKELEKLFVERSAVAGSIPMDTLNLYDQLRTRRSGIAVAVISENSCSACGSSLSAAQMQSSRASGQITLCPSCGRILYGN
jgi:predicted  nucleic acid-binding Zn-ribbon protein